MASAAFMPRLNRGLLPTSWKFCEVPGVPPPGPTPTSLDAEITKASNRTEIAKANLRLRRGSFMGRPPIDGCASGLACGATEGKAFKPETPKLCPLRMPVFCFLQLNFDAPIRLGDSVKGMPCLVKGAPDGISRPDVPVDEFVTLKASNFNQPQQLSTSGSQQVQYQSVTKQRIFSRFQSPLGSSSGPGGRRFKSS